MGRCASHAPYRLAPFSEEATTPLRGGCAAPAGPTSGPPGSRLFRELAIGPRHRPGPSGPSPAFTSGAPFPSVTAGPRPALARPVRCSSTASASLMPAGALFFGSLRRFRDSSLRRQVAPPASAPHLPRLSRSSRRSAGPAGAPPRPLPAPSLVSLSRLAATVFPCQFAHAPGHLRKFPGKTGPWVWQSGAVAPDCRRLTDIVRNFDR